MGTDIHCWAERRYQDEKWQVCANWAPFSDRKYVVFDWLAGARGRLFIKPIVEPRGVPHDASEPVKRDLAFWTPGSRNHGWLSLEELLAVDYEQFVEVEGRQTTLREFLGVDYFEEIELLKEADADRIIFWFDS